ncbi:LTA synthase family protein [Sphingomonas crusticola]|uniref:LTA synthase family protein n=1 Tax=Sphingomonas crusticola TaxID=1697973 RepID=UPI000E259488|nr:LTA synthase family protein [Sphingomonas crusticola]
MLHLLVGIGISLAAWLGLRRLVGAPLLGRPEPGRVAVLLIDAFPFVAGFALFLLPTGRPVLAGLAVLCLGAGMGVADRVKRAVLDEPVVFADRAELIEVVRHPRLYLAFVGTARMVMAVLVILLAIVWIIDLEPPLWHIGLLEAGLLALVAIAIGRALFVVPTMPAILRPMRRFYDRLVISRDPSIDAARLGLLAACIVQATLARAERPERQRAAQARSWPALPANGPILIVQGESFVDARRLDLALAGHLPNFAQLQREAVSHGKLAVPCWGANTIRSELAVLTGLSAEEVGLDRYNPYEHFARVPLPSLAHQARAAGYRTICVHPYDAGFYYRDKVMPLLGFDQFIGIEGFAGAARNGPYVSDVAVAECVARHVREHGPRVLVFAITMENHGPWDEEHDALPPAALPEAWRDLPDAAAIGRWLKHLQSTDAMIPILREAITATGAPGWLVFYGDHQPSLAGAFQAPGASDRRSDYAIWGSDAEPGVRSDLAAEDMAATLMKAMGVR